MLCSRGVRSYPGRAGVGAGFCFSPTLRRPILLISDHGQLIRRIRCCAIGIGQKPAPTPGLFGEYFTPLLCRFLK
uniref:Uncharacterized protein n=1 Tax=Anguilla anguilla TaxID=7936 RepID=A0A0E9RDA6_ANGAN